MGYLFVKDMLGDDVFYKGLHNYIRQWQGKHPLPLDFFNCMNVGSGKNLNWFWKKWFYDDGIPDLGIAEVSQTGGKAQIIIESVGTKPIPIDLVITLGNGSVKNIHQSIAVWEKGNKTTTIQLNETRKIVKVELGSVHTPDSNKKNNLWQAKVTK
jgi:aminopeptidase N